MNTEGIWSTSRAVTPLQPRWRASRLSKSGDLAGYRAGGAVVRIVGEHPIGGRHGLEADDVRLARGNGQHSRACGSDLDGRMRSLNRLGEAVQPLNRVVLAMV